MIHGSSVFLSVIGMRALFFDWGDDPGFFCALEAFGDARRRHGQSADQMFGTLFGRLIASPFLSASLA
jgi:hypothetical protein